MEEAGIALAFIAILVAVVIALKSGRNSRKDDTRNRNSQIETTGIQRSQLLQSVMQTIFDTQDRSAMAVTKLEKVAKQFTTESEKYRKAEKAYRVTIAAVLDAYELACAHYLDGTVDRKRFELELSEDIKRLHCQTKSSAPIKYDVLYSDEKSYKNLLTVFFDWFEH